MVFFSNSGVISAPFVMLIERSIGFIEELGGSVAMIARLDSGKTGE